MSEYFAFIQGDLSMNWRKGNVAQKHFLNGKDKPRMDANEREGLNHEKHEKRTRIVESRITTKKPRNEGGRQKIDRINRMNMNKGRARPPTSRNQVVLFICFKCRVAYD
jgi:hypothetical protein